MIPDNLSMKEAKGILESSFGPMSYPSFQKYYASHIRFAIYRRQSGRRNPKINRSDLEKFIRWVNENQVEFEEWKRSR